MGVCQSSVTVDLATLNKMGDSEGKSSEPDVTCSLSGVMAGVEERQFEEFTAEEIKVLRKTFQLVINADRDQVATEIFNSISENVDGAKDVYAKYRHKLSDNWCVLGLGIILLSGIERCLLRMDHGDLLKQAISRLVLTHREKHHTSPQMMVMAMWAARPVIMAYIVKAHPTENEDIFNAWSKFFTQICQLIVNK